MTRLSQPIFVCFTTNQNDVVTVGKNDLVYGLTEIYNLDLAEPVHGYFVAN